MHSFPLTWRHRSTFVCFGVVLVLILLLNLPGQVVVGPDLFSIGKYGPHFGIAQHCEHGWPWVYLKREPVMLSVPSWRLSPWRFSEGVVDFRALALVADIAIGLAIAFASGSLFEWWRRRRKQLLQFSILELLLLAGMVSVVAASFVAYRSEYLAEQKTLQAIEETPVDYWANGINERVECKQAAPSWLCQLGGDRLSKISDRVVGIDCTGEELRHVVELRHLKVVRINIEVSNRQLAMLEDLAELEALDLTLVFLDELGEVIVDGDVYQTEQYLQLPRLPNLRGLNLCGAQFRGVGLRNIPAIEMLDLTDTDIEDDSIPAILSLTKLRKLTLYHTAISDEGIERLRKALPDCEIER